MRIPGRLKAVQLICTMSLLTCIAVTWPLWFGPRTFPRMLAFPWTSALQEAEPFLAGMAVVLLLGSLFVRWSRLLIALGLALIILLVFCDVTRAQPWLIIPVMMLVAFVSYNGRVDNEAAYTSYYILLQLVPAGFYIYNGVALHDHPGVISDVLSPLSGILTERQFNGLLRAGQCLPWLVGAAGPLLIIPGLRFLGITWSLALHSTLFILLWPSATHHDLGAWLMQLFALPLIYILFSGQPVSRHYHLAHLLVTRFTYPLAGFVMLALTGHLYSWPAFSAARDESIAISQPAYQALPLYQKAFCDHCDGVVKLHYVRWSLHELHVPCAKAIEDDILQVAGVKTDAPADELLSINR